MARNSLKNPVKELSFLVEIGTEELPPHELLPLRNLLRDTLVARLQQFMVDAAMCAPTDFNDSKHISSYATPRRIAVRGQRIQLNPPTSPELKYKKIIGPRISTAYDANGKPLKAASGFFRKNTFYTRDKDIDLSELPVITEDEELHWADSPQNNDLLCRNSDKLLILHKIQPLPMDELLFGATRTAGNILSARKGMRWGQGSVQFVRPVRWAALLYNTHQEQSVDRHVKGKLLGVETGNTTYGHPFMAKRQKLKLNIDSYPEQLREASIIASFEEREALIRDRVSKSAEQIGGRAHLDPALCREVCAITEWPTVLRGECGPYYGSLPSPLLMAVLQEQQRYFPVYETKGVKDGREMLMDSFIFVSDNDGDSKQIIRGNERVLRSRLADAEFFYKQDRKIGLETLAKGLEQRIFQEELGPSQNSMWHKVKRIEKIIPMIHKATHGNKVGQLWENAHMKRAALLCKADLQSAVVNEFPKLQGIMGGIYAQYSNPRSNKHEPLPLQYESKVVCDAIGEHYLPRDAGDTLPQSALGEALALADRMDTLFACISKGKLPSGSRDPLGLRRAALGVHRILTEGQHHARLLLKKLISDIAKTQYSEQKNLAEQVFIFMFERFRESLRQNRTFPPSLIEAVCDNLSDYADPKPYRNQDCIECLEQINKFSHNSAFEKLVQLHKRLRNILYKDKSVKGKTDFGSVNKRSFQDSAEIELYVSLNDARQSLSHLHNKPNFDYASALNHLSKLVAPVEIFFNQVMVMDENKTVRKNRLALLHQLECCLREIANFSVINPGEFSPQRSTA
jgi:glycyl-tRNA synthetase beta chain